MPMTTDQKNAARVDRLRQKRRSSGMTETNVWIPVVIREAITQAVAEGKYASRQSAIASALEKEFLAKSGS
jgi:hypothetical protein